MPRTRTLEQIKIQANTFFSRGIYGLASSVDNGIYIGSSVDILKRIDVHASALRNNRHSAPKLQEHFNKYGADGLFCVLLEPCDLGNINEKELSWIEAILKPESGYSLLNSKFSKKL